MSRHRKLPILATVSDHWSIRAGIFICSNVPVEIPIDLTDAGRVDGSYMALTFGTLLSSQGADAHRQGPFRPIGGNPRYVTRSAALGSNPMPRPVPLGRRSRPQGRGATRLGEVRPNPPCLPRLAAGLLAAPFLGPMRTIVTRRRQSQIPRIPGVSSHAFGPSEQRSGFESSAAVGQANRLALAAGEHLADQVRALAVVAAAGHRLAVEPDGTGVDVATCGARAG